MCIRDRFLADLLWHPKGLAVGIVAVVLQVAVMLMNWCRPGGDLASVKHVSKPAQHI